MEYSPVDIEYVKEKLETNPSPHIARLFELMQNGADTAYLFKFGAKFLPKLKDASGKVNLALLDGYVPEIVLYFDVIAQLSSISDQHRDLAQDLAAYADGETVQIDEYYHSLDPDRAISDMFGK